MCMRVCGCERAAFVGLDWGELSKRGIVVGWRVWRFCRCVRVGVAVGLAMAQ